MLINDFKDKGFPVSIHRPIICILESGPPVPVYNRYDLKVTIENNPIKYLLGIWPGKKCTDGYPLDVEKYSQIPVPPSLHKDIDSAVKIGIFMESGKFLKVLYKPGPLSENITPIESSDKNLYDYIKKVGLQHKTRYT